MQGDHGKRQKGMSKCRLHKQKKWVSLSILTIPLLFNMNSSRPTMLPCGTPERKFFWEDSLMETNWKQYWENIDARTCTLSHKIDFHHVGVLWHLGKLVTVLLALGMRLLEMVTNDDILMYWNLNSNPEPLVNTIVVNRIYFCMFVNASSSLVVTLFLALFFQHFHTVYFIAVSNDYYDKANRTMEVTINA